MSEQMLTLTPAYGRDYKSAVEALNSWNSGADWLIVSIGPDMGRYVSVRELPAGTPVKLRYRKLTRVLIARVNQAQSLVRSTKR